MRRINAAEFKATCLALLDEVAQTGEHIVVLKRGRPVAELVPPMTEGARFPQDGLRGSVEISGDVVGPVLRARVWHAEAEDEG